MSFDEIYDHPTQGRYEITVKMIIWANDEVASIKAAERLIDAGKLARLDEDEDALDEYDVEDTEPATL